MKLVHKHLRRVLRADWHKIFQDPRRKFRRWSLGNILDRLIKGMVGGCRNLRQLELLTGLCGDRLPDTTAWDLIVQLDSTPLNIEIARGVKEAARCHELDDKELPFNLVAIDGKSLAVNTSPVNEDSVNRSQKGCRKYVNMAFRAMLASKSLKLLMGQHMIPRGTNERGAFQAFMDKLIGLYGRTKLLEVVSVDAGITSKKNAQYLTNHDIDYIMVLKNRLFSRMTQEAQALLSNKAKPDKVEKENVNGKIITRELYRCVAPALKGWESATELWRITTSTERKDSSVAIETRYFVTSIATHQLSHRQVLRAVRLHWSIENNANWVLDTAWDEDRNPWSNKALELMSLLRVLAYNLIARLKFRRLRSSNRNITWKNLLGIVQNTLFPHKNREFAATL